MKKIAKRRKLTKREKIDKLVNEAYGLMRDREELRVVHQELDRVTNELLALGFKKSKKLRIVDTFADKNTRWKSVCMNRFELEEL